MISERQSEGEILLRRYLLGETFAEEQQAVEQRLLNDQDYFDRLLRCEEELIDEYARGTMAGPDKQRFEGHFLNSPERRESLVFAQALNRYISEHAQWNPARAGLFPKWPVVMEAALMAAVVILVVALGLSVRTTVQLRERVEQDRVQLSQAGQREKVLTQQVEQQREQLNKLGQELARLQSPIFPVEPDMVVLVLTPGMSRAGDPTATANLGPRIHRLRLALRIEDGSYRSYQVELQTAEGQAVWSRDNLKARRTGRLKTVEIILPTTLLTRSDYLAILAGKTSAGIEKIGTYNFSIVRK